MRTEKKKLLKLRKLSSITSHNFPQQTPISIKQIKFNINNWNIDLKFLISFHPLKILLKYIHTQIYIYIKHQINQKKFLLFFVRVAEGFPPSGKKENLSIRNVSFGGAAFSLFAVFETFPPVFWGKRGHPQTLFSTVG